MIDKFDKDMTQDIKDTIEVNLADFYTKLIKGIELYTGRKLRVTTVKKDCGNVIVLEFPFTFDKSYLVMNFSYAVSIDEEV